MISRILYGLLLVVAYLLYIVLVVNAVGGGLTRGDWVSIVGLILFILAGLGGLWASYEVMRPKRA